MIKLNDYKILMAIYDEYIGYYDWEGLPCRIVCDEESNDGARAEIYVKGKGYKPLEVMEVVEKAVPVSEAAFKSMVLRLIAAEA